jgi:hypothetical protein
MYRNDENIRRFSKYSHFLMNHVIYYYTVEQINKLLNMKPGSVLYATLHKLPGREGMINDGEQQYEKDPITGKVKMWNVETGEFYSHADPAFWFSQFEYADEDGAIAWTINKGCDDTYVLTATACQRDLVDQANWRNGVIVSVSQDGELVRLEPAVAPPATPPPAYEVEEVVVDGSKLIPGVTGRNSMRVKITHPKLYDSLTKFMINRTRNARTLIDLTAKAHREAGNNMLIGGTGDRLKISPRALSEHIAAAFVGNSSLEADLYRSVLPNYANALAGGQGGNVKEGIRFLVGALTVIRNKDPGMSVLRLLDDLL